MMNKNSRKITGKVISSKRDKTITVLVERKGKHPIYKKILRRSSKIQAHDEAVSYTHLTLPTICRV